MNKNILSFVLIFAFVMMSCVPAAKFTALQTEKDKLKQEKVNLENAKKELHYALDQSQKTNQDLVKDLARYEKEVINMQNDLEKQQRQKALLQKEYEVLKSGQSSEMTSLLKELQELKSGLLQREDRLNELDEDLAKKQERLVELETILQKQQRMVSELKSVISDALYRFEGDGLTVEQKNGKVYLSLDEKLLFKSGSWNVEDRGKQAIKKIAQVLEENTDIDIMIEGHTDDVAYNGTGVIKDNWDLSVKRATSIVRIIIANSKVDPARLSAAGRSKYIPVDDRKTDYARKKNRRTEIILTPDLDELFQIMDESKE